MRHRWGVYTCSTAAESEPGKIRTSKGLRPVKVSSVKLFVTINGLIGDVSANFKFVNHLGIPGPAVFLFPLSNSTALNQCHGKITSRVESTERSVVLECHQSAETNDASSKVGFVIEQPASDILQLQLGFISPGDEIDITLQYSLSLDINESGMVKFTFPTFLPQQLQSNYTELCTPETYHSIDLQCRTVVSGVYRIHRVLSEQRLRVQYKDDLRNHVQIDTVGVYSPVKDFSFSLLYSGLDRPHIHLHSPVCSRQRHTHWLLSSYCAHLTMYHKSRKVPTTNLRNEYILCIDRSASMYGDKIAYVRDTVSYFIRCLRPGSYFNIISFGSTVQSLFKTSQKLITYTARKALKFRRYIKADMLGTDVLSLLKHVYSQPNQTNNSKQVYLITDGAVEKPEECIELVRHHSGSARLFTFGLDKTASRYLVTHLAKAGNGRCYHLRDCSQLSQKVIDAMRYASQSSITDLKISLFAPEGLHFSTQPDTLPQVLFAEETLSVCLIISGQPYNLEQTKCRVVLTGMLDKEEVRHVREFDLREALVTHGSPLHQLVIKSHLHTLQRDIATCNSSDEIVEISEEMVDLSVMSNLPSNHTKHISINRDTRCVLNSLPIILCRPEDNKTQFSSVVRVRFANGIDIFRSNQTMLRSLVSMYASRRTSSYGRDGQNTMVKLPVMKPLPFRVPPHSHRNRRTNRILSKDMLDSHKSSVDKILSEVGGVRLAEVDTDSLQSSIINTEIDSMSYGRYDEDSSLPELFNIIEEYPDKGRGSGEVCSIDREEQNRPTDLHVLELVKGSMSDSRQGESSHGKHTSTSDYYSMEVSPVSDMVSTSRCSRSTYYRPERLTGYSKGRVTHSRQSSNSSGVESSSTRRYFAGSSDSSIRHSTVTSVDLEPKYTSLWSQFRAQDRLESAKRNLDDSFSDTPTDELINCNPLVGDVSALVATPPTSPPHLFSAQARSTPVIGSHQQVVSTMAILPDSLENLNTMSVSRKLACPEGAKLFPGRGHTSHQRLRPDQCKPLSVKTNFSKNCPEIISKPVSAYDFDNFANKSNMPATNGHCNSVAQPVSAPGTFIKSLKMIDEDTNSENLSDIVREYDSKYRCPSSCDSTPNVEGHSTAATSYKHQEVKPSKSWRERFRNRFQMFRKLSKGS